jgi:uncharacterized spore protein YtfJ
MSEQPVDMDRHYTRAEEIVAELGEKLFGAARNSAVYSQPITQGDILVITAAEVVAGGGYGFAAGMGPRQRAFAAEGEETKKEETGAGVGGGGGGGSNARPVAVVEVGTQGVQVHPIIDRTKLGIALFTTLGAMCMAFMRMSRGRREMGG